MKNISRTLICVLLLALCLAVFPATASGEPKTISTPMFIIGKNIEEVQVFKGLTKDYPGKITWEYVKDGSSNGPLPPGITFRTPEIDSYFYIVLTGRPTESGFYGSHIRFKAGDKVIGEYYFSITIAGNMMVYIDADKSAYTSGENNFTTDEFVKIRATVIYGSSNYSYQWYKVKDGKTSKIGVDLEYQPWPQNGNLSLEDDGTTFYYVVTDKYTTWTEESPRITIHVSCNHDFDAWIPKTAATCTKDQVLKHVCTKCGYEETTKGPDKAYGHDFSEWSQYDENTMSRICKTCGAVEKKAIQAGTPTIIEQPKGGQVMDGEKHTLKVVADTTGFGTLTYQWIYNESKDDGIDIVLGEASADKAEFAVDKQGYYRARVIQTAGTSQNYTDSSSVFVHFHKMSDWTVDNAALTVSRKCTSYSDCTYAESYTFDEFKTKFPAEAGKLIVEPQPDKPEEPQSPGSESKNIGPIVLIAAAAVAVIAFVVIFLTRGKKNEKN